MEEEGSSLAGLLDSDPLYTKRVNDMPESYGRFPWHQAARVGDCSVLLLLDAVFGRDPPGRPLWEGSAGSFRRRVQAPLAALRLPAQRSESRKVLDLGSIHTGAATALWQDTQDAELVRARGRWPNTKAMAIYIQEVEALSYFSEMPTEAQLQVGLLADVAAEVLRLAVVWLLLAMPCSTWPHRLAPRSE